MVDLAMHMMDIVQNSIRAEAKNIEIEFMESNADFTLLFSVKDDGTGMSETTVKKLTDPFFTSRITRKVGLGIPFLKMTCEQTEGDLVIKSELGRGTEIIAKYNTNHPDCTPLGDLGGYLTLLLSANPDINFSFVYQLDDESFEISTQMLLEEGIDDLSNATMMQGIKSFVNENLKELFTIRDKTSFLC